MLKFNTLHRFPFIISNKLTKRIYNVLKQKSANFVFLFFTNVFYLSYLQVVQINMGRKRKLK